MHLTSPVRAHCEQAAERGACDFAALVEATDKAAAKCFSIYAHYVPQVRRRSHSAAACCA